MKVKRYISDEIELTSFHSYKEYVAAKIGCETSEINYIGGGYKGDDTFFKRNNIRNILYCVRQIAVNTYVMTIFVED